MPGPLFGRARYSRLQWRASHFRTRASCALSRPVPPLPTRCGGCWRSDSTPGPPGHVGDGRGTAGVGTGARRSRKCRCGAAHPSGDRRLAHAGLTSRHRGLTFRIRPEAQLRLGLFCWARVSVFSVICHTLQATGVTTYLKNGGTMISSRVEGNHSDEQHP